MQYSTALSDALLALACLGAAVWLGKARSRFAEADQPALFCALLGLLLPAAAALSGAVRYGLTADWREAHVLLSQASAFLGLPLLGAAALSLGRGWAWSRPAWGRLVLGLCVFFELARRMNLLEDYRLLLNLASLLLILYTGAIQWPRRAPVLAGALVSGLFLLAGLAVGTSGFLGPLRRVDLFHLLLAVAYPLLAWLLSSLPGADAAKRPVKAL